MTEVTDEQATFARTLWMCADAARGGTPWLHQGDPFWSSAYDAVVELRPRYDRTSLEGLLHHARDIWGPQYRQPLDEIVVRLMVGLGDLARKVRDGRPTELHVEAWRAEVKKELGNLIFSTIRWCDDLGFRPEECVAAAIEAQTAFARSGSPR